jgi:16S rRNA (adenine1518-N6/adenine1519-N6)-dimethyltransferase
MTGSPKLLGAAKVRDLAARLGLRPTKQWGQNFVVDANTVLPRSVPGWAR